MARKHSLEAVARELMDAARSGSAQRSSRTIVGGHERVMRQTLIALTAGAGLAEHDTPGEATIQVLSGRVVLRTGADSWELRTGDILEIPPHRHSLDAVEDSTFLLTAVPREFQ